YIIAGPLDPNISNSELLQFYGTVRVICPNLENLLGSSNLLQATPGFAVKGAKQFIDYSLADSLPGFRGMMVRLSWNQKDYGVQFQTVNQLRFMIWAKNIFGDKTNSSEDVNLKRYAAAVSDYLYEIDRNNLETPEPKAASYELPNIVDLYAKAPDYVIQGYENYKNYLFSYSSVTTDFASEVLGFVPSTQTYQKLKSLAPLKAFPNKEAPLLQEELRKFFQRGGNMSGMRTLTKEIYDTLQPGEYFFAVGFNGNMRYGRELTREEVAEIEKSGFKPARANHAFLFPGEPILTAGAFFISCDGDRVLERVNTQSGHYFYSNISSTIKEDISERSDSYFLTIGHFFTSFDTLGIVYNDVVVSKL
ncbi:MAG: hypothetical protein ACREBV_06440, partial [Candidatus Zixiibacteriota bacterium]